MNYKVFVDDNFHYMDASERYEYGTFATAEEAIAACKRMVDDELNDWRIENPGINADQLYELYTQFGSDPFVLPVGGDVQIGFNAWRYANERCHVIVATKSLREDQ